MAITVLEPKRVHRAKRAFTTRRVDINNMQSLLTGAIAPQTGDVVLARVDEIGKHKRIELTDGRRAHMFPGDEIVVCFGNRYAPDQFEAVIGVDLSPCDLVAAGGIASRELSRNLRMIQPTRITPIGLVGDGAGKRLNLRSFALPDAEVSPPVPTVVSVGTSMNAGKTLAATSLVRGLKSAGYQVAAIKATGTGAGGDLWIVRDAGADVVLDFTDAGFASTYLVPIQDVEAATRRLIARAAHLGCDIAVIEIADGLEQLETAGLLVSDEVWSSNLGVVFSAYDAMGAKCGVETLKALGHHVLGISGRLTMSPLAVREAEKATGVQVYTPWELQEGGLNTVIIARGDEVSAKNPIVSLKSFSVEHGFNGFCNGAFQKANGMSSGGPDHAKKDMIMVPFLPPPLPPGDALDNVHRALLRLVAERVMSMEVKAICAAGRQGPGSGQINRRNGYRQRFWATELGVVDVRVPRLRKGGYRPGFLAKCSVGGESMNALLGEALACGAAKNSLKNIIRSLGVTGMPDREVDRLEADIRQEARLLMERLQGPKLPPSVTEEIAHNIPDWNGACTGFGSQLPGGSDEADAEDEFHVAASSVVDPFEPISEFDSTDGSGCHDNILKSRAFTFGDEPEAD
jgi:molybdopterin-guanine dinucleotide biosynthesis protein